MIDGMANPELTTRAGVVAASLRRMILSGEVPAGARLRQGEVSERFGVSTTPVREAFMMLSREGLVRQDSHRGFTVLLPTQEDLFENYDIRIALEPLATLRAAERINLQQIDELQRILDQAKGLDDQAEVGRLARLFHSRLYEFGGRPRLGQLIEDLRNSADVYLNILLARPSKEFAAQTAREHQDILDAIRDRDRERASAEMRTHLLHNLSWTSGRLADVAEASSSVSISDPVSTS